MPATASSGPSAAQPTLLYDGDCGLCHWAVRFVLRHDRQGLFRFAPLDSEPGRSLLATFHPRNLPDTMVLIASDRAFLKGDAVLATLRLLGGRWHLLRIGSVFPRVVRDWLYDRLAERRSRLSSRFGLTCELPDEAVRGRMLER